MVLSQQALQAHVDKIDTGLASVVEAQHAGTAATQVLGAQIQQLLGHLSQTGPCMPPGQGSPAGPPPAPMAAEPTQQAASAGAEAPGAAESGGGHTGPDKSAGKGKSGAGAFSQY